VLCACIDIGTNTTRLLVADVDDGALAVVAQRRAFTLLGRGARPGAPLAAEAVEATAGAVAAQHALARELGARAVAVVATAAVRAAANRAEVVAALEARCGVRVRVLEGSEEAQLAFVGATRTLARPLDGPVAVVDVGGGSMEIAVGTAPGPPAWAATLAVGSGVLTDAHVRSDPPSARELAAMREHARETLGALSLPPANDALAVGGSATALGRLVGRELDAEALERLERRLAGVPTPALARDLGLHPERARLLRAGILLLEAVAARLGRPLEIGCGGLREGVVLELAGE
jgi:exopolyphosphatase/guanosine-5'-triphosphate,3'-diphosphate pyrophosphatase